jgi:GT2 family glycosyltransferase
MTTSVPSGDAARYRVTVVVSTYASEAFIRECLEDLEAQTIADRLEIIVVDAASPQNERAVVEEFQRRRGNIHYIRTPERIGVYAAWNLGLKAASGEYVTAFSTNDRLRPEAYELLARALDENPQVALAYGDSLITRVPHESFEKNTATAAYRWPEYSYEDLLYGCLIGPHPLWRRAVHDEVGYFDERFLALGDQDFWLRLGERYPFLHVPEYTGLYWESEDALSKRGDTPVRELTEIRERWLRRYRGRLHAMFAEAERGHVPDPQQHFRSVFGFLPRRAAGSWAFARLCELKTQAHEKQEWPYLVSAIVSTYNAESMLAACLEDLEAQTIAGRLEIIVIDSGSQQNEKAIVEDFRGRYPNIVYVRTERETLYEAWNRGIRMARGKYITNANTDDAHRRDALERLVEALETNPGADFAYADYAWSSVANDRFERPHASREIQHPDYHPAHALFYCALGCHPMWRRTLFEKVGLFDPTYSIVGDYDLFLRCVAAGLKPVHVPQTLSLFYQNPQGLTLQSTRAQDQVLLLHRRYRAEIPINHLYAVSADDPKAMAWAWLAQGELAMGVAVPWLDEPHRDPQYAYDCYRRALEHDPACTPALSNIVHILGSGGQWSEVEAIVRLYPAARSAAVDKALAERTPPAPVRLERIPARAVTGYRHPEAAGEHADLAHAGLYRQWLERHAWKESEREHLSTRLEHWPAYPAFHFLVLLAAGEEAKLAATLDSLRGQAYAGWGLTVIAQGPCPDPLFTELPNLEWIERRESSSAVLARVVAESQADWMALVDAGDGFDPRLTYMLGEYAQRHPQWRLVYTDEDRINALGIRSQPRFKPDCNPERLRAQDYIGAFCAVRREALTAVGGYAELDGARHYDLALRVLDHFGGASVGHVADVLHHRLTDNEQPLAATRVAARRALAAHLARRGAKAHVHDGLLPGTFFVEYRHPHQARVSIIVPTRDRLEMLQPCLESVLGKTAYPDFEVIVVDNGSREAATLAYLRDLPKRDGRVRVLPYPGEFNYAAINNAAAEVASGEYLLLLNNDTLIVQPNWLERLMACGQREDVGIVGARLIFLDQRLQHAGIVLGMGANGVAEHVHYGLPMTEAGQLGRTQVAQNVGAVTGACLLVRKSVYAAVGGMDARHLKMLYNDVDLCLRVAEQGYGIIWTPFATVVHYGSATLGHAPKAGRVLDQQRAEADYMLRRWLPRLANDPAHNRQLSLVRNDAAPETAVEACWDPEIEERQRVLGIGFGSHGSWIYRLQQPLAALAGSGRARTATVPYLGNRVRVPSVAELARAAPTALLLHNTVHDVHLDALSRYRRYNDVNVVFGQDDLMMNLPSRNPFSQTVFKDMKKRLRAALALCDRLVVTTEPLAEALRELIGDIRIIPNYLQRATWGGLRSSRRQGARPRVGWAGAQQHAGDLELLHDVVRATAREVEWVFMGMCPQALRPHVAEHHAGVPFAEYPAKLASLNLDIAVAPLEHHPFNVAKSNLRVLEYGALGWAVLASDIEPYRSAPVTLLPNKPGAWIEAIRARTHDLDAAARDGDRLREWVLAHWMLEDHLDEWLAALAPRSAAGCRPEPAEVAVTG